MLYFSKFISHGAVVAILKLLYVYRRVKQINKWILDNESQISHCWKKKLQIRKGGRLEWNCAAGLESEDTHTHTHTQA